MNNQITSWLLQHKVHIYFVVKELLATEPNRGKKLCVLILENTATAMITVLTSPLDPRTAITPSYIKLIYIPGTLTQSKTSGSTNCITQAQSIQPSYFQITLLLYNTQNRSTLKIHITYSKRNMETRMPAKLDQSRARHNLSTQ